MTAKIVTAYVSNNPIPASELPALLEKAHAAIIALSTGASYDAPVRAEVEKPTAPQIRKSVRDDSITSFIDGKPYKTLKRHLTSHGLDPKSYRERYGLPADYPMVAPSYAAQRSALARAIGLGSPGLRTDQRQTGKLRKSA